MFKDFPDVSVGLCQSSSSSKPPPSTSWKEHFLGNSTFKINHLLYKQNKLNEAVLKHVGIVRVDEFRHT